jgi:hypothetical protein
VGRQSVRFRCLDRRQPIKTDGAKHAIGAIPDQAAAGVEAGRLLVTLTCQMLLRESSKAAVKQFASYGDNFRSDTQKP